ncbi:bifunctional phosphoribosyl-AMP cyclohydrolase/phosphoribosyl-ATP diphosphatase HisIE [Sporosarcina contaminans]|uniref:Histidine biosynthesis bifunctional protein HisIE n=1 Tax=Sporosarcina contaminans TaxID=633403 RepID=A0ABW3TZB7_9BACL
MMENVQFHNDGLIPAIVQDVRTGEVLMLAYMNNEALKKTVETGESHFFSRSRQELWHKGATSGNRQVVKRISVDCDRDAILLEVEPIGPACHTGKTSCFYTPLYGEGRSIRNVVHEIADEIKDRKENPVEGSYTSYLFLKGIDKVLKKIGEESAEVIIGAKNSDKSELSNEIADLLYHSLVLMEISGVTIEDVKAVLRERRTKKEAVRNG